MIKDSGNRQVFDTGAVRDISEGKGRCDLMPLDIVGEILGSETLCYLGEYQKTKEETCLILALNCFFGENYSTHSDAFLNLSIHFEEGAKKYGEGNWRGLPEWTFLSSAVRHYLKFRKGMTDENHGRAFMWNVVCLMAVKGGAE